ncbi:MAG: hypothetical protein Q9167_004223 [Letrouitia subvulpina]
MFVAITVAAPVNKSIVPAGSPQAGKIPLKDQLAYESNSGQYTGNYERNSAKEKLASTGDDYKLDHVKIGTVASTPVISTTHLKRDVYTSNFAGKKLLGTDKLVNPDQMAYESNSGQYTSNYERNGAKGAKLTGGDFKINPATAKVGAIATNPIAPVTHPKKRHLEPENDQLEYSNNSGSYEQNKEAWRRSAPEQLQYDANSGSYEQNKEAKRHVGSEQMQYDSNSGSYEQNKEAKRAVGTEEMEYSNNSGTYEQNKEAW